MYKVQYEKRRQQKRKWKRRANSLRNEVADIEDLIQHYKGMAFESDEVKDKTLRTIDSLKVNLWYSAIVYEWMIQNLTGE